MPSSPIHHRLSIAQHHNRLHNNVRRNVSHTKGIKLEHATIPDDILRFGSQVIRAVNSQEKLTKPPYWNTTAPRPGKTTTALRILAFSQGWFVDSHVATTNVNSAFMSDHNTTASGSENSTSSAILTSAPFSSASQPPMIPLQRHDKWAIHPPGAGLLNRQKTFKGNRIVNKRSLPPQKVNTKNQTEAGGAPVIDSGVSKIPMKFPLEVTFENLTLQEYLESVSRPFTGLAKDIGKIYSYNQGKTIQQAMISIEQAEAIGAWFDVTAGAIISFIPVGNVVNLLQIAAEVGADLAKNKDPDPLMIATLVAGVFPATTITNRIMKLTQQGGKITRYGLQIGNRVLDIAIMSQAIKIAVESGEPLAIYQALLASGMSVKNSYDMARRLSYELKIKKNIETSAQLEQLITLQKKPAEDSISSAMIVRPFRFGEKNLVGRINENELEISTDEGVTWNQGSKVHLLAYRLQNAGGKPKYYENNTITNRLQEGDASVFKNKGYIDAAANLPIKTPFIYSRNDSNKQIQHKDFTIASLYEGGEMENIITVSHGSQLSSAMMGQMVGEWGGKFKFNDDVEFIKVRNGASGTVGIKIELDKLQENVPVIISGGKLSGCTVIYAVDDKYFYAYHAGQKPGDINWLTSKDGVESIYKVHVSLKGRIIPGISGYNNETLKKIFSTYHSSLITYFGKNSPTIGDTHISKSAGSSVNVFDYNHAKYTGKKPRLGFSYALLSRGNGVTRVSTFSDDIIIIPQGNEIKSLSSEIKELYYDNVKDSIHQKLMVKKDADQENKIGKKPTGLVDEHAESISKLKSDFIDDINFLNKRHSIGKLTRVNNKIDKAQADLIRLFLHEARYTRHGQTVPDSLQQDVRTAISKVDKLKHLSQLPVRVNAYLKAAQDKPELRTVQFSFERGTYQRIISSTLLKEIPDLEYIFNLDSMINSSDHG